MQIESDLDFFQNRRMPLAEVRDYVLQRDLVYQLRSLMPFGKPTFRSVEIICESCTLSSSCVPRVDNGVNSCHW